ncbi:MAG: M16 family metallopeptidase [Bacteroidia bacterium]
MRAKILLFVFSVSICFGQNNLKPTDKLPLSPDVKTGVLKNGMMYYIQKNKKPENRAELRLVVNAGSTMESDEQQGLAHFVEHMAFNGSKNFKKNDLVNYLESIGTKFGPDLNAYTSFDETVYMLQIPTDKEDVLNKGLSILKDWSHYLSFDSIEIEKERGVVMEEWRLGQGAMERMNRKTWPVLFKDSRYAVRLPIGKPEVLQHCKQSYLKQFYTDWYRPDNQAIVVVGDIDPVKMEEKIKKMFGDIPATKNPKPVKEWQVPDQKDIRVAVATDKEASMNMIQLMYFQKEKEQLITYADFKESIKRELYNGMINSRLSELTKQKNPPFMFGYSGYMSFIRSKSSYGSFAVIPNGKELDALKALITENERVKRFGFTKTEFERQKKQLMTSMENQFNEKDKTESKQIVMQYVYHFLQKNAVPGIENEYNYYKALVPEITLEEVNELAKRWITTNGENVAAIMMLTESDESAKITEEVIKKTFFEAQNNKDITAYEDKVVNEPLVPRKPTAQKVFKTQDRGYGITEWTLGNGVKVVLKPTDFKNDEILFSAQSFGGVSQYDKKDYINADYSNTIQMESGYGKFDATALEKYLQDKTVNIYPGVGKYTESLNGNSSKKDFETLLQLIYLTFTKPRKDSVAFASVMERTKAFIENSGKNPDQVFSDSISYFMSGYHVSAKPETLEDLDKVNLDRAHQIFKERYKDPTDFVFYFVGSFNLDEVKPLIEAYIGGISASTKHEEVKDIGVKTPEGAHTKIYYKGNEPRSRVNLTWNNSFEYNRKNRFELMALMKLLNIKLRENLREDKGGVYGVGIYPIPVKIPKEGLQITCVFACAPENVDKLVNAALDEIADVKKNGCNSENLTKVTEGFLKERELDLKENRFWLSYISSADMYSEEISDLDKYNDWVKSLKNDDFKVFANKYINDKELKKFILNPEK